MPIRTTTDWLDFYSTERAGLVPSATVSFLEAITDEADLTTYTITGSFGTADSGRYIIAAVGGRSSATLKTISSVTIGGVSATAVSGANQANTLNRVALYIALVPTGTSGNIVVTWSGAMVRCNVGLWRAENINPTAEAVGVSTATPMTSALSVSAKSIQVAAIHNSDGTLGAAWTGTNGATEDFDVSGGTNSEFSGASRSSPSAVTVTSTCTVTTPNQPCYASASFASA